MSRNSAARAFDPVPVFAALGDRTRHALITRLTDGRPRSIAQLCADSDITRQAVTKHLRALEHAGLVRSTRVGRERRFAFEPRTVDQLRTYLDTVSQQWDSALSRLQRFVED
ncbi:MAG: metalloregulator ArsR/SmtB family transcription factor [Myxococcota bacterium]